MIIYILKTKERENVNIELWGGMIKKMLCMKCSSQNWWIKGLPEYALTPLVQSKPRHLQDPDQQNPLKLVEFKQLRTQETVPWPLSEAHMSNSHVFSLFFFFQLLSWLIWYNIIINVTEKTESNVTCRGLFFSVENSLSLNWLWVERGTELKWKTSWKSQKGF